MCGLKKNGDKEPYRQVIEKAIKKHAGLSDFDFEGIEAETKAILKALDKAGFEIKSKGQSISNTWSRMIDL